MGKVKGYYLDDDYDVSVNPDFDVVKNWFSSVDLDIEGMLLSMDELMGGYAPVM